MRARAGPTTSGPWSPTWRGALTSDGHQNLAFQVFHEGGVLGLLPLPANQYNLVWSLSLPRFDHLVNLGEADFLAELNAKLQSCADSGRARPPRLARQASRRFGFHLTTSNLENYFSGGRVVFLGDAAHTIHPMLGQGLNLGLRDAHALGLRLARALGRGRGLACAEELLGFEAEAKLRNYAFQAAVEALKVGFESPWAEPARRLGAGLLGASAGARAELYRVANFYT